MGNNRSRAGVMVGLAAVAGAFGVAAMMSTATAPTARADDFGDVISAVDGDFTAGQTAFTTAFSDFGSSEVNDGLAALVNGANDDLVSSGENLFIGTVEALTNETVTASLPWDLSPPADFADGLSDAEAIVVDAEGYLGLAGTELSGGDYAEAAYFGTLGFGYITVDPLDQLLLGVAASL
jgi:hypothetical protein